MCSTIQVLILANQTDRPFWPFTGMVRVPLLPICGKPIIAYLLDIIAAQAPANITVLIDRDDHATLAVATRRHWPRVTLTPSSDFFQPNSRPTLVLKADVVPDAAAINEAIQALRSGKFASHLISRPDFWLLADQNTNAIPLVERHCGDNMLKKAASYFRLAMQAQKGELFGLHAEGWADDDGIRTGRAARVLTRRAPGINVSVGHNAFVDQNVQLGDNSIIGDGAFISRSAWIKNSIVLPGSYVPPGMQVHNSIVCNSCIYDVNTDYMNNISDHSQLSVSKVA